MAYRLVLLAIVGCSDAGAGAVSAPVVYGPTDDRMEVFEHPSEVHRAIAETAVAMQLGAEWLAYDGSEVHITYEQTLGEAHGLCPDVRYADQIEPGTCSGTLLDARHLLTAGHCVSAGGDCDGGSWPWVFGFYNEAPGALRPLGPDDVYYCTRTVVLSDAWGADYAVIELDRPVVGHAPAPVRRAAGDAPLGTAVTIIGHPNGIPMKIAGGAVVRGAAGIELFADLDAFFGNSGSGVFDDAGELVGILVAGAPEDFRRRRGAGCDEIVVIDPPPEADGEVVTAVATPIEAFCATGVDSPVCDGPPPDAGDAGIDDAGTGGGDAATATPDAGTAEPDATTTDGGAMTGREGGGCSCRADAGDSGAGWLALVVVLAAGTSRRLRAWRRLRN